VVRRVPLVAAAAGDSFFSGAGQREATSAATKLLGKKKEVTLVKD